MNMTDVIEKEVEAVSPENGAEEPTNERQVTPGDPQGREVSRGEKLVPVSESIRYRKRAQQAEQKLTELQGQLEEAQQQLAQTRRQIEQVEQRQKIDQLLIEADAIDLEAARLLTEATIEQMDDAEVGEVVEDLRRHKPYLFRQRSSGGGMSPRPRNGSPAVEEAAQTAAGSGDRRDLLRYLRLRRNRATR